MKTPLTQIIASSFLLLNAVSQAHSTMTVSGPITASAVNVTGDVTMSSVTVSSLTVTNSLSGLGVGLPGVIQMQFSSTTFETSLTSTTFQPISGMAASIALSSATDYVRISLMGTLATADLSASAYLTIKRGTTDLGNTTDNSGLIAATDNNTGSGLPIYNSTGITITDAPGDIIQHTYQAYMRTSTSTVQAMFTPNQVGYLLLEEMRP